MNFQPSISRRATPQPANPPLHDNLLVARILAARGVTSARELEYALKDLPTPDTLLGIEPAVTRLASAISEKQKITIVGDYDCDGATSTTVAMLALSSMGAENVQYLVPNRFEFGYGLSSEIVDVAATDHPDLLITVDNGIASVDGVERARELNIDVIVTDHHLPPPVLPRAVAIVNPNIPGATFPSRALAGVGVIFYVMLALRSHLKSIDWFASRGLAEPRLAELLDLVAIGTVADVVPLDKVNRTMVEQGLRRIRAGHTRPGVQALIAAAGCSVQGFAAIDIGFAIGPRLNAAGRLDDIGIGIQCLLTTRKQEATRLAAELNSLNQQRRAIEQEMREEAHLMVTETISQLPARLGQPMSLCLFEPHWHQGVIGILAGRLKDTLHVPVIIFAEAGDGNLKGSGRSIPGVHLRDVLDTIATNNPGTIEKFGGHAMAAGLSLPSAALAEFKLAFDEVISSQLDGVPSKKHWLTDGELEPAEFSLENAAALRLVAPWGQDFPEPTFDGEFVVRAVRVLKERHLKLRVSPAGSQLSIDAIAFNQTPDLAIDQSVRLVYRLEVNEFRSKFSLQLQILFINAD